MSPDRAREKLVTAAREAARGMHEAVQDKPGEAEIKADAKTLANMAALLKDLSNEVSNCGGEACFARAVNGIRTWVPLDSFNDQGKRLSEMAAENEKLRAALAEIAGERPSLGSRIVPGQRGATRAFEIARAALGPAVDQKEEDVGRHFAS